MMLCIDIHDDVRDRFPDLEVRTCEIVGIAVSDVDASLEGFKEKVYSTLRNKFTLEGLRDEPIFRVYRDFFWRIGIDPTKTRPAAEALIRRILIGKPVPRISTAVDAYNLASISTCIALAAFDVEKLDGSLTMTFAQAGEKFLGVGMQNPVNLRGGEIVMRDASRLIAIYPYRDADYSKITMKTKHILLISCGAPGISSDRLKEAVDIASEYVKMFCGGELVRTALDV